MHKPSLTFISVLSDFISFINSIGRREKADKKSHTEKNAIFQNPILTLRENEQSKSNFRHPIQFSTPTVESLIEKISPKYMILEQ